MFYVVPYTICVSNSYHNSLTFCSWWRNLPTFLSPVFFCRYPVLHSLQSLFNFNPSHHSTADPTNVSFSQSWNNLYLLKCKQIHQFLSSSSAVLLTCLFHSSPHNLHTVHFWIITVSIFVLPLTDSQSVIGVPGGSFSLHYHYGLLSIRTVESVFPMADSSLFCKAFRAQHQSLSFLILILSCQETKIFRCQKRISRNN